MWLLVVIMLDLGSYNNPPHVLSMEVVDTFASHSKCKKKVQEYFDSAKEQGITIPTSQNMGCIPLNKQET